MLPALRRIETWLGYLVSSSRSLSTFILKDWVYIDIQMIEEYLFGLPFWPRLDYK